MKSSKVLCSMIVLLGMIFGLAGASADGYQFVWDRLYDEGQSGAWTPVQHSPQDTGSLAQSFVAPYPFIGVRIASPSWNGTGAGFRMRLFAWNTDYATSVAGAVLGEASIVNYADNSNPQLMLAADVPAGNYLLVTDEGVSGTGACGHWGWAGSNSFVDPTTAAFGNGVINDGFVYDIGIAQSFPRNYTTVENFFTGGADAAISLTTYAKIGQRFTATLSFNAVELNTPAWSTEGVKGFTARLWTWAGDYATTVAQTPLATNVHTQIHDNFWYVVENNTVLPPGVYFWEMSEPTSTTADLSVGVWWNSQSAYNEGEAYLNGVAQGATAMTWTNIYADGGGTWTPFNFGSYLNYSQSFEATNTFYGVGMHSPSWGPHAVGGGQSYRMTLYHWNTDWATSVAGTPIAQQTFADYPDNGTNKIEIPAGLPPGQYLLDTDQPVWGTAPNTGQPGHWGWTGSSYNTGTDVPNMYVDGYKSTDYGYVNPVFDMVLGYAVEEPRGADFLSRSVLRDDLAVMDWTQY